jgi:hypothetical protein
MPPITRSDDEIKLLLICNSVIDRMTGCWNWQRSLKDMGYGRISWRGEAVRVHRVSYELFIGPIPPGYTIDHLCRNRGCINPEHLEAVTRGENVSRGGNSLKTTCPKGHLYDKVRKNGSRGCTICDRETARRLHARTPIEAKRTQRAKAYADNREKAIARSREWYRDNKERAAERQRKYRETHREEIRQMKERWRAEQRRKGIRPT